MESDKLSDPPSKHAQNMSSDSNPQIRNDNYDLKDNALMKDLDLVQIDLDEGWKVIFRRKFDLWHQNEPFITKFVLVHPETGSFVERIFGKTWTKGRWRSQHDLEVKLEEFFERTRPCLGFGGLEGLDLTFTSPDDPCWKAEVTEKGHVDIVNSKRGIAK